MKQVEQFVTFMAAYELETFIDENYETRVVASKFKSVITLIINYCITNFMDNIYVVDFNKRGTAAQESTNILQEEEDDKSISLGMPVWRGFTLAMSMDLDLGFRGRRRWRFRERD